MQAVNFGSKAWLQNGPLILKMAKHVCNVNASTFMLCTQFVFSCPCCCHVGCIWSLCYSCVLNIYNHKKLKHNVMINGLEKTNSHAKQIKCKRM